MRPDKQTEFASLNSISVKPLTAMQTDRWDAFVRANPQATFFHLAAWRSILEQEFGCSSHYLLAERNGDIAGVLPLCRVRNLLAGDVLVSTPFLVYGGPVADDEDVRDALAGSAADLASDLGVDYLELRNRDPLPGMWETRSSHATFRKRLEPNVDANLQAIPRKQRAMVRKGLKADLAVSWDPDVSRFYAVFAESYRNLGTPVFAQSLFARLLDTFADSIWVTTLSHGEQPLASVLSFVFRDEVLPYYGGSVQQARTYAANDLMYWLVMERAVEEGIEVFDYGRSKIDSGSYRFKKHWGFEPEPLAYQYRLGKAAALPNLSPTNPKFALPIEVWKRLPLGVANLIGPSIARRLV